MASSATGSSQATPLKRSYDGQPVSESSAQGTPLKTQLDEFQQRSRQSSPALSTTSSSLTDPPPSLGQGPTSTDPNAPPPKKRKLTFAEREVEKAVERAEKEARAQAKAEAKLKREDEARLKAEARRLKAEQSEAAKREKELEKERKQQAKEAEQKLKDAEKVLKDAEKARNEEEKQKKEQAKQQAKLKKDQSQLRIGSFFGRPAPASTPPSTPDDVSSGVSSRRSSICGLELEKPKLDNKGTPLKNCEYEKVFPPFFVFEGTDIALANRFLLGRENEITTMPNLSGTAVVTLSDVLQTMRSSRRRGVKRARVQGVRELHDVAEALNNDTVDLTTETSTNVLGTIPLKYISFYHKYLDHNIRPPYHGTFTRKISPRSSSKLPRNPFHRGIPDTNYDYDSEEEWEPPQEGDEDINIEDSESEDEGDEADMEDFLDDENDNIRRKIVVRESEPISSGLCWQYEVQSDTPFRMQDFQIDVLDDAHQFPIDPHSTRYWAKPAKSPMKVEKPDEVTTKMQPPRMPLSSISTPNVITNSVFMPALHNKIKEERDDSKPLASARASKAIKRIPDHLLPSFKAAISGSDLTKAGLIEILKKQFPKCSKDAIKDTLSAVAVREGAKEADKKWVLIA